jgi:hypothetical protein
VRDHPRMVARSRTGLDGPRWGGVAETSTDARDVTLWVEWPRLTRRSTHLLIHRSCVARPGAWPSTRTRCRAPPGRAPRRNGDRRRRRGARLTLTRAATSSGSTLAAGWPGFVTASIRRSP